MITDGIRISNVSVSFLVNRLSNKKFELLSVRPSKDLNWSTLYKTENA